MSRGAWVLILLFVLLIGLAFVFASVDTRQPVKTIVVPVQQHG